MENGNGKKDADRLMLWKALEVAIGVIISMTAWVTTQNHMMLLDLKDKTAAEHELMWKAIESKVDHTEVPSPELLRRFEIMEKRLERIESKIDRLE